jgi:hypothetical protein
MSNSSRLNEKKLPDLGALVVFGTAFGFVEAAVVYYLRFLLKFNVNLVPTNYKVLLNLGFITFVSPQHPVLINSRLNAIEITREAATIIMLAAIAFVASKSLKQRFGAFLVCFACWDITYYIFLKIVDNWPSSLMTKDVFFLIPVTWIGPVVTPLVISVVMLIAGSRLFLRP